MYKPNYVSNRNLRPIILNLLLLSLSIYNTLTGCLNHYRVKQIIRLKKVEFTTIYDVKRTPNQDYHSS